MTAATGSPRYEPPEPAPTFTLHETPETDPHNPARRRRELTRSSVVHLLIDLALMGLVIGTVTVALWTADDLFTSDSVRLGVGVAIVVAAALGIFGAYDGLQARRWPAALADVVKSVFIGAAVFSFAGFFVAIGGGARRWLLIVTALWIIVLGGHHVARALWRSSSTARRVIIAGAPRDALSMRTALRFDRRNRYYVVGFVLSSLTDDTPKLVTDMALGSIGELPDVVERHDADEVIFCLGGLDGSKFAPVARRLNRNGVDVALTGLGDVAVRRVGVSHVQGRPVVSIAPAVRTGWRMATKRVVDIIGALVLLALLAPLLFGVALAIRIVDRHPAIFRQERVGKDGELFEIFKFRSMRPERTGVEIDLRNEYDGPLFKMEADPRITRIGRFMRRTSIDELPQLVNVLKGNMSLVGPRPFIPSEVEAAPTSFRDRELVTPGMTGRWQVSGRSDTGFDELDELDRWYVDNWSLGEDLEILARTVPAVLLQRGAK